MSAISVYALRCGFDESHKANFYDSLINVVRKLREKNIIVIAGDLNGHVDYKEEHGQKTIRNSMKAMVVELRIGKGKASGVFCSYEQSNHLVESPSHI